MRYVTPTETVRLWVIYQENGIPVTGLIDLKVEGKDEAENVVLEEQDLTEIETSGKYYYDWVTPISVKDKVITIIYKREAVELFSEQYNFESLKDSNAGGAAF